MPIAQQLEPTIAEIDLAAVQFEVAGNDLFDTTGDATIVSEWKDLSIEPTQPLTDSIYVDEADDQPVMFESLDTTIDVVDEAPGGV